jgi:hypothetical protein
MKCMVALVGCLLSCSAMSQEIQLTNPEAQRVKITLDMCVFEIRHFWSPSKLDIYANVDNTGVIKVAAGRLVQYQILCCLKANDVVGDLNNSADPTMAAEVNRCDWHKMRDEWNKTAECLNLPINLLKYHPECTENKQ